MGQWIDQQQQTSKALAQIEDEFKAYSRKLAIVVFLKLYGEIDHDLLFSSEIDLVLPKIQKASRQVLYAMSSTLSWDDKNSAWMVEILAQHTWVYIQNRPKSG